MSYYDRRPTYQNRDRFSRSQRPYRNGAHANPSEEDLRGLPAKEEIKYPEGCAFDEIKEVTEKSIESFKERGFEKLMPVQANTFDAIYNRSNVVARDLTGSGKTLAFCLPLVERYRKRGYFETGRGPRKLRAIILAPTRELAIQVTNELKKLKHSNNEYNVLTVYGGVPIQE